MLDITKIPYRQARWYMPHNGPRDIRFITIHTIQGPESLRSAEDCAQDFATRAAYRMENGKRVDQRASAHYCCDANSVIQCIQTKDIAWAARRVGNRYGVHIEHAGRAEQTEAQWADAYSDAMLRLSAELCAGLCKKFGLPMIWLDAQALRAGGRGITGHAQISEAWGGTHWDPGPHFPVERYIGYVQRAA